MTVLCASCHKTLSATTDHGELVSHGICPECMVKHYSKFYKFCPACEGVGTDMDAYGKQVTCPECEGQRIVKINANGGMVAE